MTDWAKVLHRRKQHVRGWLYPVQHRLRMSVRRTTAPNGSVVMLFDDSTRYGGWVDRLKGMISSYELAALTNRRFRLYVGPTFPVTDLLDPATFDWRVSPAELRWHPLQAAFHVSRDRLAPEFAALRTSTRRDLFVDTNLDYLKALHPELSAREIATLWGRRYRELFTPRRRFAEEIESHARAGAIGVHARFTGLLGDFTDVVDNALPVEKQRELLRDTVAHVAQIAAEAGSRTVCVFSDSRTFLDAAANLAPNIYIVPGAPSHIDRTASPREALHKTLLDFYVMCACTKIVSLRLGAMYASSFSRYASYVSGAEWSEITS